MATGTGTFTGTARPPQKANQIETGREWPSYPGEPMDITPSSTGPLDIMPTANRSQGP